MQKQHCVQVVGCSGAVFGFMGLYVADMALNFHSLSFPWLRLIWIGSTLAYFVVATITQVRYVMFSVKNSLATQLSKIYSEDSFWW